MAYFLKQSKIKGRNYLAIYESFYNPEKKETAHKTFKSLGSVETLIKNGLEDPITYYQKEVDKLNAERNQITEKSIKGHFLICYITVLLERLLQFKVFNSEFSTNELFRLFKGVKIIKNENNYINATRDSELISAIAEKYNLPINNYYLNNYQINQILKLKI